ncbi:conjugal transfer protein [Mycolicibacter acidiphilus]|uniref:conjugal transfer protein n=1 Tax=Mycolicibacter acidiphilus TaxID=2835306 RepID=UPI0027DCC6D4|nr:conjugal transfer protein [Mycolicibacter acidiphilus]
MSSFVQDYVSSWLTATNSDTTTLAQFVTVNPTEMRLPATPALVITSPTVVAVSFAGMGGKKHDAELYSVVVGVNERPYESASPHRTLYRVPVLWSKYGPRAISLPARVGGPGPGAELPLPYTATLAASDPAFAAVQGFLTAYLTSAGGVERFTSAESMLTGLGDAYQTVTVTGVRAAGGTPPATPTEHQTVRVLARADAVTSQYAPMQLTYPLTLRGLGGRWVVAGIDQTPAVSVDDELTPVVNPAHPAGS